MPSEGVVTRVKDFHVQNCCGIYVEKMVSEAPSNLGIPRDDILTSIPEKISEKITVHHEGYGIVRVLVGTGKTMVVVVPVISRTKRVENTKTSRQTQTVRREV